MTGRRMLRVVAMLGVVGLLVALCGCGSSGPSTAACSSCQEAYTLEQCQAWGARAGCKESTTTETMTCAAGIAGCAFKDCAGPPICDDTGEASCASCSGSYTQEQCDGFAAAAGCGTAETMNVTACGSPATGCDFTGCDFQPDC
jgi:hypothetical protein